MFFYVFFVWTINDKLELTDWVSGQLEVQMRRNRDSLTEEEDCPTSLALIRVSNLNNLKCLNQTASFELFHPNFFD